MKTYTHRALSLVLTLALLLTATVTGMVLPTSALQPEPGEVELFPKPERINLLTGQGATATERIWRPVADMADPAAGSMTIEAGVSGKYWNLSFLELNTTYTLSGRVKGGGMGFYFYPQIPRVNNTTGGSQSPKVKEDEWTTFSYTFTTGDKRPTREFDWIWFGNTDGTTTAYLDSLSLVKTNIADLAVTDFTWNSMSHTLAPGDVVDGFSVTVTNKGETIPADAEFAVDICLNATQELDTFVHEGGLPAGESVTFTSRRKWTAVAGDHALTASVKGTRYLYEYTRTTEDNQLFYNVYVSETALAVPEVAAKHGMTALTFSDHFDNVNTIDNNATGAAGYKWYVTRPYGESTQKLDTDYSVENGILRLHTEQTKWAYSIATIDIAKPVGFAFNKGYLEYRIRVPVAGDEGWDSGWTGDKDNGSVRNPGVWAYPTTTLWASAKQEKNADSVEMDWMEYYGTKYVHKFGTTLHERHSEYVYNEETGKTEWKQTWHTAVGQSSYDDIGSETEFHTLSCLWEDGHVTTYVDGKLIHTIGYATDDAPSDRSSQYSDKPTAGTLSGMDTQFLPIILGGSEQFQMEVDFVRVWQIPEDAVPEEKAFAFAQDHVEVGLGVRDYLTVVDANGNEVTGLSFKSSDTSVLSVYGDGYVRANNVGTATVMATDTFGNTATCFVTVNRYAELIQGGDFDGHVLQARWNHILWGHLRADAQEPAIAELATENGNTYLKIKKSESVGTRYYKNVPLKAGRTYTVKFRYKGNFTFRIYDQNNYIASGSEGRFNLSSTSWKNASYTFTVADTVSNTGNLTSATIGFLNIANQEGCVDDFSIQEVAPANTITVQQAAGGTIKVSKTTGLTAGETVTVTVTPNNGYLLKVGSLTYTTQDGVVRQILNNATVVGNEEVYGGSGTTFRMKVPVGATTVTASFESTAQNNYQFGTVGSAVRHVDDKVDAVRFLNRLYIDGLDLSGDALQIKHNGQTRTVKQIGVLLMRGQQDAITLEDYEAYKADKTQPRVWHALSYKYTSSTLFVLQYTDSYLDFIINMTTSSANNRDFLLRDYTICGYMLLDNGEEIYTTAFYDNAADALAREAE